MVHVGAPGRFDRPGRLLTAQAAGPFHVLASEAPRGVRAESELMNYPLPLTSLLTADVPAQNEQNRTSPTTSCQSSTRPASRRQADPADARYDIRNR